jgi:hypothetical protein
VLLTFRIEATVDVLPNVLALELHHLRYVRLPSILYVFDPNAHRCNVVVVCVFSFDSLNIFSVEVFLQG